MVSLDFDVRDDSKEGRTLRFPDVAPQKLPTRVVVRTRKSDDLGALRSMRLGQVEVDDLRHRWCMRGLSARSARGYNIKGGERGRTLCKALGGRDGEPEHVRDDLVVRRVRVRDLLEEVVCRLVRPGEERILQARQSGEYKTR